MYVRTYLFSVRANSTQVQKSFAWFLCSELSYVCIFVEASDLTKNYPNSVFHRTSKWQNSFHKTLRICITNVPVTSIAIAGDSVVLDAVAWFSHVLCVFPRGAGLLIVPSTPWNLSQKFFMHSNSVRVPGDIWVVTVWRHLVWLTTRPPACASSRLASPRLVVHSIQPMVIT